LKSLTIHFGKEQIHDAGLAIFDGARLETRGTSADARRHFYCLPITPVPAIGSNRLAVFITVLGAKRDFSC
jgi:hypothetical protein